MLKLAMKITVFHSFDNVPSHWIWIDPIKNVGKCLNLGFEWIPECNCRISNQFEVIAAYGNYDGKSLILFV